MRKLAFFFFITAILTQAGFCKEPFLAGSTLSLGDCIAVGLENNPDIMAAGRKVEALVSGVGAAKGDYWPRIGFESDYIRANYINNVTGPASSLLVGSFTTYISEFYASWVLEDFGKRFAEVGGAEAQLAQAEAGYKEARLKGIYEISKAYFRLLEAQSLLKVSQDAEGAAEKHLELARQFVQTGESSRIDLAKARVVYSGAKYRLMKAQNDLANAKVNLSKAMGLSDPPSYEIRQDSSISPLQLNLIGAKAIAFKSRPDLLAENASLNEATARLDKLKAEQWPVLSGNAGYGWLDQTFPPGITIWGLGISLNWPLFNGGKLGNQIQEADRLEEKVEEEKKGMVIKISSEVEEKFRDVKSATERLQAAGDEVGAASDNQALALARYKAGLGSPVELADAEADLSRAEADQVEARGDFQLAQAALRLAIGIESP